MEENIISYTNIQNIISYTHKIITYYFVFFPYLTPIINLYTVTIFYYFTVFHWYLLGGRCWMSILEDKFKDKNEPKTNMLNFLNDQKLPLTNIIIHFNLLMASYRLNLIIYGIGLFITLIIMNKLVYKSYLFKSIVE